MIDEPQLQDATDCYDIRRFCSGVKGVYEPKVSVSVSLWSADAASVFTELLQPWNEHFESVLKQQSDFNHTVLDEIPQ